jgi:hypothetical protein
VIVDSITGVAVPLTTKASAPIAASVKHKKSSAVLLG